MKNLKVTLISFSLIILVTTPAWSAGVDSPTEARDLVSADVLKGDTDGRRIAVHPDLLSPGTAIETWHETAITTPAAGYVVFVDDLAFANFEHPCRYVFVDQATGGMTVVSATTPPNDVLSWLEADTEAYRALMRAENRRAPRPAIKSPPRKSGRGGDLWAVLMNGGASQGNNHVRYWNDLSNIYTTLVDVYGYEDDHIIVLCSDGLDPSVDQSNGYNSDPDLDGDGDDDIMYSCVLSNVDLVFNQLVTTLSASDQLFVFTTDHGGTNGGWDTYQNLWNYEELSDAHFASLLDALPQCDMIFTLEPCYSGGFLDNITYSDGRVGSSACRHDEYSWAMPPDYVYDTYVFFWTAAVKWEDAYGVPCDADTNNDDVVDIHEAFIYAEANDFSDEEPQYHSQPAGLGDEINLGVEKILDMTMLSDPGAMQAPGLSNMLSLSIETGLENYVPGSGYLHYRFDPAASWIDVSLSDLGNNLFEALLPATRPGDEPEFYFSAQGDLGTTVYEPKNAPIDVFSFDVCMVRTFFDDDFEADTGWKVVNVAVSHGAWERGVPMGTGDYGDPSKDADGSGACYITENSDSYNADVDGGPTRLTSPAFDLSSGDAVVSFYRWFYNDDGDDPFMTHISNDGGATWVAIETIYGGVGGWTPISFDVSDYVTPSTDVMVRFSTKDHPDNSITEAGVDGFKVERYDFAPTLWADAYSLSTATGADIGLFIDAAAANAYRPYAVVAGLKGSEPGTTLPGGVVLPVTWDWLVSWTFNNPGAPALSDFQGNLDANGEALPGFSVLGPGLTPYIGKSLTLAFALTDNFDFASNPVFVSIEP